jgi:hypothetical protein
MTCTFAQSDGTVLNTITFILAALCFTHTYIQKTLIQTSYPIPPDCLNFPNTCCICVNNSHVETVKYLLNENYCILILINIKNFTS